MTTIIQVLLGSTLLGLCSLLQILMIVFAVRSIKKLTLKLHHFPSAHRWAAFFLVAFSSVLFGHTIQIWSWALTFVWLGALQDMSQAIYFSIVTYTTVGYGDVTVGEGFRIFAAMASITGLLNFGLSAALLVGLITRMLDEK